MRRGSLRRDTTPPTDRRWPDLPPGSRTTARDGGALESLIAHGFEFVHSTGRVEDRASFIRRATAGQLASQRTPGERLELRYRVFGDTVIGTTLMSQALFAFPCHRC